MSTYQGSVVGFDDNYTVPELTELVELLGEELVKEQTAKQYSYQYRGPALRKKISEGVELELGFPRKVETDDDGNILTKKTRAGEVVNVYAESDQEHIKRASLSDEVDTAALNAMAFKLIAEEPVDFSVMKASGGRIPQKYMEKAAGFLARVEAEVNTTDDLVAKYQQFVGRAYEDDFDGFTVEEVAASLQRIEKAVLQSADV